MAKIDDYIAEVAAQYPNPIVNDGGVDRFMTEEEKSAWYIFSAEKRIEKENEENAKVEAAASRQVLLDKLGITQEEAKLLLS
jgi:hypothetical protein